MTTPGVRYQAAVVLPTLNEELGLDRTLSELPLDRFRDPRAPVLTVIIDGGSTDKTLDVAQRWGVPVLHQRSKGKGAAVLEAIDWVRDQQIPHVAMLDADATYPPSAIVPALQLLREGSDLVVGVRRPVGGPPKNLRTLVHRVGNVALSYSASILARRPLLDVCSGFWAVSTERFHALGIGAAEFAIEAELILKAAAGGLRITQFPIEYRDRVGEAKIRAVHDGAGIFLAILAFGQRSPSPHVPAVAGIPTREVLSISLIAGSTQATLEASPAEFAIANRIGLLLQRSLPKTSVRIQPTSTEEGANAPAAQGSAAPLVVSLRSPGAEDSRTPLSVAIDPKGHAVTVHLLPESERTRAPPTRRRWAWNLPGVGSAADVPPRAAVATLLSAVISRLDWDPSVQQRTLLAANGFDVRVVPPTPVARPPGGVP